MQAFEIIDHLSQLILAAIAGFALWYAIKQYNLTRNRSIEDNRPYVHIELDRVTSGLLDLVIRNTGNSSAKDIQIKFTPNISLYEHSKSKLNSYKFLKNMKFLAANKSFNFFFGSVIGGSTTISREFSVHIEYKDLDGRKYESTQVIDPRDFKELVSISRLGIHDVAKNLEDIKKALDKNVKESEKLVYRLEKGILSPDSVYANLNDQDTFRLLLNLVTVGIEGVHNEFPMLNEAKMIARLGRDRILVKAKLTKKDKDLLVALNDFETSNYDFDTEVVVNKAISALKAYLK